MKKLDVADVVEDYKKYFKKKSCGSSCLKITFIFVILAAIAGAIAFYVIKNRVEIDYYEDDDYDFDIDDSIYAEEDEFVD
ncbi:MAG: hypothetical protein FWF50_04630 [Defluviitaleaceae bacterium]|nr:hypothetical protein [Defluviitaleaceae bacterium]